ncbi:MAG TPA: sulfite exporter TauE/SafE family protein [Kofleriaceae bacterium]|nr:sulfite exporter TauE/SafE family protein [Kofleriaceae bacterium]
MIEMFAAVCASSVAGSVHCAAMCGPLVGLWDDPSHRIAPHLAHAGGRAIAYVTLGVIAGAIGGALDLAGAMLDVQRVAWLIAAAAVTAWGVITLLGALGVIARAPGSRLFGRGLVQLRRKRPIARAALVGVLSAALPCGWLWAFVVLAGGTGGPVTGGLVMLAFWIGTVPMMLGAGALVSPIARRLGRKFPIVSAALLIGLGTFALVERAPLAAPAAHSCCHGHGPH